MIAVLLFSVFIYLPIRFVWRLIWHFEILSFREVFTVEDAYLFDCSFKQFIKEILIYEKL